MWLATREASRRPPRKRPAKEIGLADLSKQLGSMTDAIAYRRLAEEHPEVELGPDQDRVDHFKRLQRQRDFWRSTDTTETDRRAADPRLQVHEDPDAKLPSWMTEPRAEDKTPPPGTPAGLPQRIPGWFTGDAMDAPPPGYGVPPLSRRDPGRTMRQPATPSAAVPQQSYEDWVKWLGTKGIQIDPSGHRVSPQSQLQPSRQQTSVGPQIWHQFVDEPYKGRHRAAMAAFVKAVLLDLDGVEISKVAMWETP